MTIVRVHGLGSDVAQRVEPVVEQVQAQLGELPERVVQVIEPVAARVARPRRLCCLGALRPGDSVRACSRPSPVVSAPPVSFPGSYAPSHPSEVVAIVNTADDDEFHGLYVSPDLDSVTYTLAGASNAAQGWGLEGETFATLDALARYGVTTWFRLGDKDLATHLYRTRAPARRARRSRR